MPTYRTTCGCQFGHREIAITLSDDAGIEPHWLIEFFEHSIREGKQYRANETVQIGWMVTMLKEASDGDLEVWEPQFDSIPIKWTRGVNNTLRHLIVQRSITGLLDCEPVFPSLRQAGTVSPIFLKHHNEFLMERATPSGNDSGWCFLDVTKERSGNELKSLFEISFHCMHIIPFLALPPGTRVSKRHEVVTVQLRNRTILSSENETLKRVVESEILV
jgi:hypothetical protein